jgi:hypothetical protein
MNKIVKKALNSGLVSKMTGEVVKNQVSKINPTEAISQLYSAYSEYKQVVQHEKTKRKEIEAVKKVDIERIHAQRDIIMTYLDKSFDERKDIFKKYFDVLDAALESGQIDTIVKTLDSITGLAKSSPFKDIASIVQVKKMIDNEEPINL